MDKLRFDNKLRAYRTPTRRAFTLIEMVVAMGVLVLMLVLAGQVFTITVQSTGQATALVDLNQSIRAFERQIRDDLAHVYPGESLMAIQCNPVNAYWTPEGRQADDDDSPTDGYAHNSDPEREAFNLNDLTPVLKDGRPVLTLPRADILMMFTAKRSRSYVAPEVQSNLQEVVYGHAILGEYVADPNTPGKFNFEPAAGSGSTSGSGLTSPSDRMFPAPTINGTGLVAPLPASSWHLARREVHLIPSDVPSLHPALPATQLALDWLSTSVFGPQDRPGVGPGLASDDLLTGAIDIVVNFDYTSMVKQIDLSLVSGPYAPVANSVKKANGWMLPWVFGRDGRATNPMARSELDTTPPPTLASRLGQYMLPNCASFKVEFSLNPRSDFVAGRLDGVNEILWIDLGHTEDPVGQTNAADDDSLSSIQEALDRATANNQTTLETRLQDLLQSVETRADGAKYSLWERIRGGAFAAKSPPSGYGDFEPWDSLTDALDGTNTNRANTQVFAATRPVHSDLTTGAVTASDLDNVVPDPVFPSAIRITIDVFDPQRRLGRPTRYVIIAPVGG